MLRQPFPVVMVFVEVMTVDDDSFLTETSSLVCVFSNSKTFFGARSRGRRITSAPVTSQVSRKLLIPSLLSLLLPTSLELALERVLPIEVLLWVEGKDTAPLEISALTRAARTDSGSDAHVSNTVDERLAASARFNSEFTRGGFFPNLVSPVSSSLCSSASNQVEKDQEISMLEIKFTQAALRYWQPIHDFNTNLPILLSDHCRRTFRVPVTPISRIQPENSINCKVQQSTSVLTLSKQGHAQKKTSWWFWWSYCRGYSANSSKFQWWYYVMRTANGSTVFIPRPWSEK